MTLSRGPVVLRRRLGAALKRLRGEQGLHLDVVARQLEMSSSKLSRLETGHVAPKLRDVRDLLLLYQAPEDLRDRVMRWATDAREPGWWHPFSDATAADLDLYISLEAEARKVRIYSLPMSGLLQTEGYARALLAGGAPQATPAELERLIEIRVRRQAVLDSNEAGDRPPLQLHAVLDEYGLQRMADTEVMREQLHELLIRADWPNITIQVLPFVAGFTRANGTFAIFEPLDPSDGIVANVESTGQDAYFETPTELAKYEAIWENVVARSLDPDQTVAFIKRMLQAMR